MINPLDYVPTTRKFWIIFVVAVVAVALGTWLTYRHYHNMAYLDLMLGREEVEGVAESGFHYQEETDSKPFRWTNGDGKLLVPINTRRPPTRLWVSIETFRPKMKPIGFRVLVGDTVVFDGEVPPGKWEETFDLTNHQFSNPTMVELLSDTFIPEGVMDEGKNTDTRILGVQVQGVMLTRDEN